MKLNKLIETDLDISVKGIVDDSRLVKSGYIFVATRGFNVDHFNHIKDAIDNGAVFLIVDREIDFSFPHILVDDINNYYKELCLKYYDINLDEFNFIGITGTDGKTTTATIISRLIENSAYIGTNGLTINGKTISTSNTTPCISELYSDLRRIKDAGIKTVVMEVSSEALLHNRVDNIKFDIVGFTNITGDHLNVHGDFKNYLESKLKLLNLVKENGYVVVNNDDINLRKIKYKNIYSFGKKNANFIIKNISFMGENVIINIEYKDINYSIKSPLKGEYNVYNVVMAFIIGKLYGENVNIMINKIESLKPISGRCEFLDFGQDFDIILDYAHTINGISSILDTFRDHDTLITVTGCAGGREHKKRSVIGKMIMDKSDISIFTMDDPRYESVDSIIDEMVGQNTDYIRIVDREEAINYALDIAPPNSALLILGKGRDEYMAIKDKKYKYSDYEVIKKYFENRF
ncbi:MAG: UDP-N-acetylmuramoyl-L-alanyl-D-glutamate--2,6-diaminopimelate ligase [Bacilli bacterium]|nr:UDP-N-acetylmuramoyl-L-alanyl-D-glutamate--2,6-diaminopimelate ligase [Bacilli bacterium]